MTAWQTRIYIRPTTHHHTLLNLRTARSTLNPSARSMASSSVRPSVVPQADLESFQEHLNKSTRILALIGAGLSASSGLPTFRGAGGLWRTHEATDLATPEAFSRDPGLVWQFYSYRRHMALKAKPNPAHYALAELARKKEKFLALSQNVDGTDNPPTSPPLPRNLALYCGMLTVTCNRPLPARPASRTLAEAPPWLPVRRQVLRFLLQLSGEEQLYRPHRPSPRTPNIRRGPHNNLRRCRSRTRHIRRKRSHSGVER